MQFLLSAISNIRRLQLF